MSAPLQVSLAGRDLLRISDLAPAEAEAILHRHKVEKLPDGAVGFQNSGLMVRRSRKVGVGESDSAKGCGSQDFTRCWFSILAKKESRLWINVGMAPAIEHDPGNVASCVKARLTEHQGQLLANLPLVFAIRS